uniref:Uncharacterized protein n=2 Tax=Aegilops tauschii TaxID=37682 RepID=A0A453K1H6_AEGTS
AEPGERVPEALAPEVMPFIRAADEVELLNPRVAFLWKSRLTTTPPHPTFLQQKMMLAPLRTSTKYD